MCVCVLFVALFFWQPEFLQLLEQKIFYSSSIFVTTVNISRHYSSGAFRYRRLCRFFGKLPEFECCEVLNVWTPRRLRPASGREELLLWRKLIPACPHPSFFPVSRFSGSASWLQLPPAHSFHVPLSMTESQCHIHWKIITSTSSLYLFNISGQLMGSVHWDTCPDNSSSSPRPSGSHVTRLRWRC